MPKYYCRECAIKRGFLNENSLITNYTGSVYQLNKFIKHTLPTQYYDINSIFDDKSYSAYEDYIVNTRALGSVETDELNRHNIVYCAGKDIGLTIISGSIQIPNDAVKVVLYQNDNKIHCYPTGSVGFLNEVCFDCGKNIVK